MAAYKMILFDKDGTLLEFESTWLHVAIEVVESFIERFNLTVDKDVILKDLGVENGHIDAHGVLASGTAKDTIKVFSSYTDEPVAEWAKEAMSSAAKAHMDDFKLIDGVDHVLRILKENGYKLGIVTADDDESTMFFLNKFNIADDFDILITSDRSEYQKPDKRVLDPLFDTMEIAPEEVVVIGDTPHDINLGINSDVGFVIGVLSGTGTAADLEEADIIINSVRDIVTDGKILWE